MLTFFAASFLVFGSIVHANSYTLSLATTNSATTIYSPEVAADSNESLVVDVVNYTYQSSSYQGIIALEVDTGSGWVQLIKNSNVLPSDKITLQGPCKIRIAGTSGYYSSNSYRKMYMDLLYSKTLTEQQEPSKKFATVIPENSPGNVSIVLEQSTDLINWTAVNPGSFPSSTTKRFFRVRAQE
jgi:hypothetical protein